MADCCLLFAEQTVVESCLHFSHLSSNTILMKWLSKLLFVIWIFVLSVILSSIIYNTRGVEAEIDINEMENLCNAIGQSYPQRSSTLRIATYNLLADGVGYYGGRDFRRCEGSMNILENVDADVIGLQEVSRWWFCNIKNNTEYEFIDSLRTELGGFMTAIAYNPQKVEVLEYGNIPLKKGSNFRLRRIVWGLFRSKGTGQVFLVVNTHFNVMASDNSSGLVQAEQLTSFVLDLNRKYNCPVVVTGDFNAKKRGAVSYCSSAVYDLLNLKMTDARSVAQNRSYGSGKSLYAACCDHIFTVGGVTVERSVMLSQKELKGLSDHYAIFTDVYW